ncbi:hypothetical protein QC764_0077940 [Podospora pseudoanserina]|uniref:Uncharacterized protein n=1 Tax=Podospora pseudoanserina TaxID=2609844 RepID=A0ABR0I4X5_9PEZI|nr:hypothetical protein QC764_0077940 [Podospora pseudoanserina]
MCRQVRLHFEPCGHFIKIKVVRCHSRHCGFVPGRENNRAITERKYTDNFRRYPGCPDERCQYYWDGWHASKGGEGERGRERERERERERVYY